MGYPFTEDEIRILRTRLQIANKTYGISVVLQLISIVIPLIFVTIRIVKPDFSIIIGSISFTADFFIALAPIPLFIATAILKQKRMQDQRTEIYCFLRKYDEAEDNSYDESVFEAFKTAYSSMNIADIADAKIREGMQVSLHESRNYFRRKLILCSAVGLTLLTLLLVYIFHFSFPITIAVISALIYSLVLVDYFYYQHLIRKAGFQFYSDYRKELINFDTPDELGDYTCLTWILRMRKDRLTNYIDSMGIATLALNFVSILLGLTGKIASISVRNFLRLPSHDSMDSITIFLVLLNLLVFAVNLVCANGSKLIKYEGWNFIVKNLANDLKCIKQCECGKYMKKYETVLTYKAAFFSNALDISRGKHSYNVEIMEQDISAKDKPHIHKKKIHANHTALLTHAFVTHLERIFFFSAITGFALFCFLVWHLQSLDYLFNVLLAAMFIFVVSCIGVRLFINIRWRKWRKFEKENQYRLNVRCPLDSTIKHAYRYGRK